MNPVEEHAPSKEEFLEVILKILLPNFSLSGFIWMILFLYLFVLQHVREKKNQNYFS